MVVIRGVVGRLDGADARVLRAVATGEVRLATSDEGLREIAKVMGYDDVKAKVREPVRVFEAGLDIGIMGTMYRSRKLDWPSLRDPKDGWLLDLAFESGADYIVTRDRHFLDHLSAMEALGFQILTPPRLLRLLPPQP